MYVCMYVGRYMHMCIYIQRYIYLFNYLFFMYAECVYERLNE